MQIVDILNSSKNWVMKWSVHSKKEDFFPGKSLANTELALHSLKITLTYQSIEAVQLYAS